MARHRYRPEDVDLEMLKVLVEAGEDLNASATIEGRQQTALQTGISSGKSKSVMLLLEAGARADDLPANAWGYLVFQPQVAIAVKEHGAKVPMGDSQLLQCAIWKDPSLPLVRALIAEGSSLQALKLTGREIHNPHVGNAGAELLPVLLVAGYKTNGTESQESAHNIEFLLRAWASDSSGYRQELHSSAWTRRRLGIQLWNAAWTSDE
jgi:hypothetical protein